MNNDDDEYFDEDPAIAFMETDDPNGYIVQWLNHFSGKPEEILDEMHFEVALAEFKLEAFSDKIAFLEKEINVVKIQTAFKVWFMHQCVTNPDKKWFLYSDLLNNFTGASFDAIAPDHDRKNYYANLNNTISTLPFDSKKENGIIHFLNLLEYDHSKLYPEEDSLDDRVTHFDFKKKD